MLRALGLTTLLLCSWACRAESDQELSLEKLKRRPVGPGLELVEASLLRGTAPGGRAFLIHADPSPLDLTLELNTERSPLSKLAPDALLTMNAAFFTPGYTPTGLLVSKGRQLHPFVKEAGGAGSGVVLLEDETLELLERDAVGRRDWSKSRLAIQAGPRVVEPGGRPGIRTDDKVRANRSFIGRDAAGRLVLGVLLGPSGWSSGPSLYELQKVLLDQKLGDGRLDFALNLDGGPSTGLYLRHPEHPVSEPEGAAVYSYLVLRPRE